MTATAAQVAQVRRMVHEPDESTYSDEEIQATIESYPAIDERGEEPYTWDTSTQPPTKDANEDWIPTYDLHAAAADIWEEKAAIVSQDFGFSADGGQFSRDQVYEQFMKQARYHRSRRKAGTIHLTMSPKTDEARTLSWVVNRSEVT